MVPVDALSMACEQHVTASPCDSQLLDLSRVSAGGDGRTFARNRVDLLEERARVVREEDLLVAVHERDGRRVDAKPALGLLCKLLEYRVERTLLPLGARRRGRTLACDGVGVGGRRDESSGETDRVDGALSPPFVGRHRRAELAGPRRELGEAQVGRGRRRVVKVWRVEAHVSSCVLTGGVREEKGP